jgi:glutaredoxin
MSSAEQTPILYTHPDCTYSAAKQAELDEEGVDYQRVDLALEPDRWAELEELTGGERITPVFVGPARLEVGFHGVG